MTNKIICPNCGEKIDIENLIKEGAKTTLDKELKLQKEKYEKQLKLLEQETLNLKKNSKTELEKAVVEAIEETLNNQKIEYKKKEEKLKQSIMDENKEALELLEKELEDKTNKLKELNKLKAENSKIAREKQELEDKIKAEKEKEYTLKLIEEKQKLQKQADEKYELQILELKKQLQDQINLTQEMKKRQEQGSMQLQGEVQELAIEEYLRQNFKFDEIKEISKGDYGADSIQIINTQDKMNIGTIYYESKRTKTFKEDWIIKFKKDLQEKSADIGVLVTSVYPKDMSKMGYKDGIYICSYEEFKALCFILRQNIIQISKIKSQQENTHEKSALLYNYLTSSEFSFQIETIVNSFVAMQNDLNSEKRAMNKIWKKREKEIENVISATCGMYGSIQGIAGNKIPQIEMLEMPLLETLEE